MIINVTEFDLGEKSPYFLIMTKEKCPYAYIDEKYVHDCDKPKGHAGKHYCEQHKVEW